jgi:hypothetical protein
MYQLQHTTTNEVNLKIMLLRKRGGMGGEIDYIPSKMPGNFFFWWDWGLESGFPSYKIGALLPESHLQSTWKLLTVMYNTGETLNNSMIMTSNIYMVKHIIDQHPTDF